jgi:mannose-6-phosphate isomerase-like protein (cupin superfamily)
MSFMAISEWAAPSYVTASFLQAWRLALVVGPERFFPLSGGRPAPQREISSSLRETLTRQPTVKAAMDLAIGKTARLLILQFSRLLRLCIPSPRRSWRLGGPGCSIAVLERGSNGEPQSAVLKSKGGILDVAGAPSPSGVRKGAPMKTHVQHLDELPHYEQDSGENITYQFVVRPGSMGRMSAGRVRLEGPTTKTLDAHEGWDQVYIVLKGEGTVIVGGSEFRVRAGHVARIPQGTRHGVVLREGQRLEYVYVNAFRDLDALRELAGQYPEPQAG